MINREKVIKGLYAHGYRDCKSCPYWGSGENGKSLCTQLAREAFALLKEQEAVTAHDPGGFCQKCGWMLYPEDHPKFCGNCGHPVKWE